MLAEPRRNLSVDRSFDEVLIHSRRIFGRAWKIRAFTAATEMPMPAAISFIERPSNS